MAIVADHMADRSTDADGRYEPGTRVEVLQRFDARWARGFEVVSCTDGGYRVRRSSDNAELPGVFTFEDVRRERRRDTWWY